MAHVRSRKGKCRLAKMYHRSVNLVSETFQLLTRHLVSVCVSDQNSRINQCHEQLTALSSHHPVTTFSTFLSRNIGPYSRNQVSDLVPGRFVLHSDCLIG
jgi:hypothetical protein